MMISRTTIAAMTMTAITSCLLGGDSADCTVDRSAPPVKGRERRACERDQTSRPASRDGGVVDREIALGLVIHGELCSAAVAGGDELRTPVRVVEQPPKVGPEGNG